jgi:hypothetical protein
VDQLSDQTSAGTLTKALDRKLFAHRAHAILISGSSADG